MVSILERHWKVGLHWVSYSLLGMVGLWGAALLFFVVKSHIPWYSFVDRGQMCLYSVGFISPCFFTLIKDRKVTDIPFRKISTFAAIALAFFSLLLYGATTAISIFSEGDHSIDVTTLRVLGGVVLALSFMLAFAVAVTAEEREAKDISALSEQGARELEKEFDREVAAGL